MLDFVRKAPVFKHLDEESGGAAGFGKATNQTVGVLGALSSVELCRVAQINPDRLDLLARLGDRNDCFALEGWPDAPKAESVDMSGARSAKEAHLGDYDAVFSVGAFDAVGNDQLSALVAASFGLVRRGGFVVHSFQFYLERQPTPYWTQRYRALVEFFARPDVAPLAADPPARLAFEPDMASTSDEQMFAWSKVSPGMRDLRLRAQNVALVFGARRVR